MEEIVFRDAKEAQEGIGLEASSPRIQRGLKQAGEFWRAEDGGAADFRGSVMENFAGDQAACTAVRNWIWADQTSRPIASSFSRFSS
jgi:hypothetical protein